jgi:hypothetical protein
VKSLERIVAMRDFMWKLSQSVDADAEASGDEAEIQLAHDLSVFVGTLDWVLTEDLPDLDGEITSEVVLYEG